MTQNRRFSVIVIDNLAESCYLRNHYFKKLETWS